MASASTPSANEPAKDLILVHTLQLDKSTNLWKNGLYLSDVASASVNSEKSHLKKLMMMEMIIFIIGERSEPLSRVFNDQPRGIYIWWNPYVRTLLIRMLLIRMRMYA